MKKSLFCLLIFCLLHILVAYNLLGYSFTVARSNITHDLLLQDIQPKNIKLAIVFNTLQRSQLQENFNLVEFKKELAHSFLEKFKVADPSIVRDILKKNNIKPQTLKTDLFALQEFIYRADSDYVLFTELSPIGSSLNMKLEVIDRYGKVRSTFKKIYPAQNFKKAQFDSETIEEQDAFFSPTVFEMGMINREHNDAWLHFAPTALLVPETHAFEFSIWMKDLSKTKIPPKYFRYDFRYKQLQFGIQSYAHVSEAPQATFGSIKFNAIDEDMIPVNVSFGLRYRVWRNDHDETNEFLNEDKGIEKENLDQNRITLELMLTSRIERIGLLINGYVNNQVATLGGKFSIIESIKILGEAIYYYYPGDHKDTDSAFGIEFFPISSNSFRITYQNNTEQWLFGTQFSF